MLATPCNLIEWPPHQMDDRRSSDRTKTSKAGSIFFGKQASDVEVRDLTNGGAGIFKQGLAILPLTFELTLDNLRRTCRIAWRKGSFFGVAFVDYNSPTNGDIEVREGDITIEGPAVSLFDHPPQLAHPDDIEAMTEFASQIVERKGNGQSDVRFTVGVAVALALPVLISFGAYVAATVVLRTG